MIEIMQSPDGEALMLRVTSPHRVVTLGSNPSDIEAVAVTGDSISPTGLSKALKNGLTGRANDFQLVPRADPSVFGARIAYALETIASKLSEKNELMKYNVNLIDVDLSSSI